jgi:hypothetical protein
MKLSARIDAIVERLRHAGVDVQLIENPPWICEIEARLGRSLPQTYRELVSRYSFPSLECDSVVLFANLGDPTHDDLSVAPFRDPILSPWLINSGYFHFARDASGGYDPICLDLASAEFPTQTAPVVKFDHEAMLCDQPPVRRTVVAESFLNLLESQTWRFEA